MANFKKFIGMTFKNVVMDDMDGYFQDIPNTILDIEIGKLVGKPVVTEGENGLKYWRPRITQDVEVKYYKNGELINTEIGFFWTYKGSHKVDLYTRREGIDKKYEFGIAVK